MTSLVAELWEELISACVMMRASEVIDGSIESEDIPCGAEAFLGFPRPTGCSVGGAAHAGYIRCGGCEIASARDMLATRDDCWL